MNKVLMSPAALDYNVRVGHLVFYLGEWRLGVALNNRELPHPVEIEIMDTIDPIVYNYYLDKFDWIKM